MKVYCEPTSKGINHAINDIHHRTYDGGYHHRIAVAKVQRKAARRFAKKEIHLEINNYIKEVKTL